MADGSPAISLRKHKESAREPSAKVPPRVSGGERRGNLSGRFAHYCCKKVLAYLERNYKDFTPAPILHIPKSDCPLAENIVNNLAEADCHDEAANVVEELGELFMFGEVKFKEVLGHWGG